MTMTLPKPFSHMYMTKLIADQLVPFIKNPETLPPVTCLYGFPGCGKTEFAKVFASSFALITDYHAMNEYSDAHVRSKAFAKDLKADTNTNVLSFSDDKQKCFNHVTILDEFHDLNKRAQASFKTRFDRIKDTDRVFIIINTKEKQKAKDVLHDAIFSRALCIDFNLIMSDAEVHAKFLTKKFKNLTASQISNFLPDMRRITRENNLRSRK
ncbi:AAA family ATPase [Gammaproteobacteria bacterium]|nr:AAA family ATPase [Gammaproteobacteria bacterium]